MCVCVCTCASMRTDDVFADMFCMCVWCVALCFSLEFFIPLRGQTTASRPKARNSGPTPSRAVLCEAQLKKTHKHMQPPFAWL